MIIDLEEKTESGSFDLKGGGKVHLRLLSGDDLKAITKATSSVVPEYVLLKDPNETIERYHRFESRKFDSDLFDEMTWDLAITGWDNLFDKNEKPIPVTKEMKVYLMTSGKAPEFVEAVNNGLKALRESEKANREASEKN